MFDRFRFINYLQIIQKREITNFISIVNSNIQTFKKITKNIEIIKKSTLKKLIFTNFTSFKNALLRVLSKLILTFKHNEIVIKIQKNTINFIRKKKFVRHVNTCVERNKI